MQLSCNSLMEDGFLHDDSRGVRVNGEIVTERKDLLVLLTKKVCLLEWESMAEIKLALNLL